MIIAAIIATVLAVLWSALVYFAREWAAPADPDRSSVGRLTLTMVWCIALLLWAMWGLDRAKAADLAPPMLPHEIMFGRSYNGGTALGLFGTYSDAYMRKRWRRMCAGPARYDAMREAYEAGKAQPCQ